MKSKDKKRKRKVASPWYAAWEGSDLNALTGTSKLDACGFSPLHYACINGQLDAVVYLIDVFKADPNITYTSLSFFLFIFFLIFDIHFQL